MKHFLIVGFLVLAALIVRFGVSSGIGLDVYIHATYYVIPFRTIGFWLLLTVALIWLLVAPYKFARPAS